MVKKKSYAKIGSFPEFYFSKIQFEKETEKDFQQKKMFDNH